MKIGMIFECGPQGADKQVCEYLARQLNPDLEVVSRTLDNKANLLKEVGPVAKQLLVGGCSCVLVVWDLRPAWPDKNNKPCRKVECDALRLSLSNAGVAANARVFLVCIEQELESWLLADENKLSKYLSTDAHQYKVGKVAKPDKNMQPKSAVINHFKSGRGWRYDDKVHAVKVISTGTLDRKKLRRSDSFARFEGKVLGCGVAG